MSTPEEILQGLYDETLVGNAPRVLELTEEGLTIDMEPQTLLFDALSPHSRRSVRASSAATSSCPRC